MTHDDSTINIVLVIIIIIIITATTQTITSTIKNVQARNVHKNIKLVVVIVKMNADTFPTYRQHSISHRDMKDCIIHRMNMAR